MVFLDGRLMTDKKAVHDRLAAQLRLPLWYGRNLDALYDVLTGEIPPVHLVLIHGRDLKNHLGSYGESLIQTLQDAADAVPGMKLTVYE